MSQRTKDTIADNCICICGSPLILTPANHCYFDSNEEVECDECSTIIKGNTNVYHCQENKSSKHDEGFDLCTFCVLKPAAKCICGYKLILCEAQTCYNDSNEIECDKCAKVIKGNKKVFHCTNTKTKKHDQGYDLCSFCALFSDSNPLKSKSYNRNEILVCGYIREIQMILNHKDIIIPTEIYEICHEFFMSGIIPCIYINEYNKTTPIQFGLLDILSKKYTILITNKLNKKKESIPYSRARTLCKIPNINNSKAIITCVYDTTQNKNNRSHSSTSLQYKSYPYLFTYDTSYINDTIHIKNEIKSKQSIPCLPKQFLSCEYNGIVYEYNGKLFKHNLKNIFANFIEIKQQKQKFQFNNNTRRAYWLDMTYLKQNNSIFCVSNHGVGPVNLKKLKKAKMQKYSIVCNIFNLRNRKWIDGIPLSGKCLWNGTTFESCCCYDNNSIFIANTLRNTAKYDIEKQKWINIIEDNEFYGSRNSILWIENGKILNVLNQNKLSEYDQVFKTLKWNCIDLRENKKQCLQKTEIIDGFPDISNKDLMLFQ